MRVVMFHCTFCKLIQLKDRVTNSLKRETPGPNYVHFPRWLGEWFYDELTYEERGADGKWRKPGKGANEAFDLMVYCDAITISAWLRQDELGFTESLGDGMGKQSTCIQSG